MLDFLVNLLKLSFHSLKLFVSLKTTNQYTLKWNYLASMSADLA